MTGDRASFGARLVPVSTDPDSTLGAVVECATCGAVARTDNPPPPGQVIVCATCTLRLLAGTG